MKVKENLILRHIGDTWAIFPIGDALNEYGNIMKLNDTGAFMWNILKNDCSKEELIAALMKEYSIDIEKAASAVDSFVNMLDTCHTLIHT